MIEESGGIAVDRMMSDGFFGGLGDVGVSFPGKKGDQGGAFFPWVQRVQGFQSYRTRSPSRCSFW